MEFFGFELKRKKEDKPKREERSFIAPMKDDGAVEIETRGEQGAVAGGVVVSNAFSASSSSSLTDHQQRILKYRQMANNPEVDEAIENIVNDAITIDEESGPVEIRLDDVELSESVKNKIQEEFKSLMKMIDFKHRGYDYFREWYIDSVINFQMIPHANMSKGIKEVRRIDPVHLKKVREIVREKDQQTGADIIKEIREYYIYKNVNPRVGQHTLIQLHPDSIISVTSGRYDERRRTIVGYLHKAIKSMNNLTSVENASVIYRLARAPERRAIYIDIGSMPKAAGEQYVRKLMQKYQKKIVYDSATGEVDNENRHMSILEDFWLPRRGDKGTQIDTLPGGQNLGEIEDITYFQKKLYKALNVPITRLESENMISLGRSTEITRDELKFSKFVQRLRMRFTGIFDQFLKTQLVMKKIITEADWEKIKDDIRYDFLEDFYITEQKELELMEQRINVVDRMREIIGKYYSHDYVRKFILHMTEEQIKEEDKKIKEEKNNPQFQDQDEMGGGFGGGGFGGGDDGGGFEPPEPDDEPEVDVTQREPDGGGEDNEKKKEEE